MLVAVTMRHAALFHPVTGARLRPAGYRRDGRPIMPIIGGAPREDDDFEPDPGSDDGGKGGGGADDAADDDDDAADRDSDDDSDDDDSADDDDDDGKGSKTRAKAPLKPDGKPYTQADVDKLARSLRAARRNARAKKDGTDGKGADGDGKGGTEPDEATIAARAEDVAAKTWKPLIVNQAARAALVEAGLIGKPDRLLRLLDPEDIDVDPESGDIDGLDEQIAELRREYKHLFRRTGTRRLDASRDRDGDGRGRGKLTATELQALQLTGRA